MFDCVMDIYTYFLRLGAEMLSNVKILMLDGIVDVIKNSRWCERVQSNIKLIRPWKENWPSL